MSSPFAPPRLASDAASSPPEVPKASLSQEPLRSSHPLSTTHESPAASYSPLPLLKVKQTLYLFRTGARPAPSHPCVRARPRLHWWHTLLAILPARKRLEPSDREIPKYASALSDRYARTSVGQGGSGYLAVNADRQAQLRSGRAARDRDPEIA